VNPLHGETLSSNADMKDVGEAMFVILVIALTFVVTIVWAKWNQRKRKRK